METFAAAFGIVWLAVVLFVARMALRQRKLQHSFESLRSQMEASQHDHASRARAA